MQQHPLFAAELIKRGRLIRAVGHVRRTVIEGEAF
jgi:hypothetical protein